MQPAGGLIGPLVKLAAELEHQVDQVVGFELIGDVLDVMKSLCGKVAMLIVTHEMGFARNVADEIIFMEGGVIVEQGPPKEMFTNAKTARAKEFLGRIGALYGEEENRE